MNKYDELVQRIDHMESLLSSYMVSVDEGFIVFGEGFLYSDSTLSYRSNVPLKVPENLYRDIRVAMINLYRHVEDELAEAKRRLSIVDELLEK